MTPNDLITIIGVNIALLGAFSGMMYWMMNRVDGDVKDLRGDIKSLSTRMDGHTTRIDQIYKMFVDLLQARK